MTDSRTSLTTLQRRQYDAGKPLKYVPNDILLPCCTRNAVRDRIWSGCTARPVEVDCRMAALLRSLAARLPPMS